MPERRIWDRLRSSAGVTAIVPAVRITPVRMFQGDDRPAITFQVISRVMENHSTGALTCGVVRLQLNLWADTYERVKALADAVRVALTGWREAGTGTRITMVHLDSESDAPEMVDPGSATGAHCVRQDWLSEFVTDGTT